MSDNLKDLLVFSKTLSVLYVEDNEIARTATLTLLDEFFNDITVAIDGKDGLTKYAANSFDLILTDINMPNLNGIAMAKEIRAKDPVIPILILSAHDDAGYFLEAIKLGIDGYLLKPVILDQFTAMLHKTLDNIRLRRENEAYKQDLEARIEEEIERRRKNEEILETREKMAAMGDMIDAIAHQWMQPLSIIKLKSQLLKNKFKENENVVSTVQVIDQQINHLSNTLKEFRTFFKPDKEVRCFNLRNSLETVLVLMDDAMKNAKIEIELESDEALELCGFENEIKHIFINLINNAKDAFIANDIEARRITISLHEHGENILATVRDNAGGIPQGILDSIFKPRISSKEENSGIGLYMSQQIAMKHHAQLSCENVDNGAKFTLDIPKAFKGM